MADTKRITLSDGRWVEMSLILTGADMAFVMEMEGADAETAVSLYPQFIASLKRHVVKHNLPLPKGISGDRRDIALQEAATLNEVWRKWNEALVNGALPKDSGRRSVKRS